MCFLIGYPMPKSMPETTYNQTTKMYSAGCNYVFVHVYMCTIMIKRGGYQFQSLGDYERVWGKKGKGEVM